MGLREEFREALKAVAAAAPQAAHVLRHGEGEAGAAVQSSLHSFADPVNETAPGEAARFLADASHFPTLKEGSAVELDGSLRVVVSLKSDPVGATFSIGLSHPFEKCPASYSGVRREFGRTRQLRLPLDVLLLENGTAENFSDALAPSYAAAYLVAVRREDWPETSDPEPADAIEVAPGGHPIALKVSTVTRHDGWYILKCRIKG